MTLPPGRSIGELARKVESLTELNNKWWKPFNDKVAALKGAPGTAQTALPDEVDGISSVRYQHGIIYQRKDGACVWVFGAINDLYQRLGGQKSWLGLPVADEADLPDGEKGRVSVFDNGQIYWWADVGAIEVNDVVVQYTGLACRGETSELSASDEPYAMINLAAPGTPPAYVRSQVYEDVDKGDFRPETLDLYRGKPRGLVVTIALMENDEGDPNKYEGEFKGATKAGAAAISAAIGAAVPVLAPFLAIGAPVILKAADELGSAINKFLGTGDDHLGTISVPLTTKDLVVLAARTPQSGGDLKFKKEIGPFNGDDGNYVVYLDVNPA